LHAGWQKKRPCGFEQEDWRVIWKCRPPKPEATGGAGYASIVVSEGAGVRQYVTVMGRGAVGVAAADGKLLLDLWARGQRHGQHPNPRGV